MENISVKSVDVPRVSESKLDGVPMLHGTRKRVTILGGVHGNELMGTKIVNRLVAELQSGRWAMPKANTELVLALGNPEAIKKGTRATTADSDLNRSFPLELSKSQESSAVEKQPKSVEEARAKELAPYLMKTDILLDIHATNLPSEPFIRVAGQCTEDHMRVASWFAKLPAQTTEHMKLLLDPMYEIGGFPCTTDEFVNSFGGIGVCLETGLYDDLSMEDEVYTRVLEMLNYEIGLYDVKGDFAWPKQNVDPVTFLRPYGITRVSIPDESNPSEKAAAIIDMNEKEEQAYREALSKPKKRSPEESSRAENVERSPWELSQPTQKVNISKPVSTQDTGEKKENDFLDEEGENSTSEPLDKHRVMSRADALHEDDIQIVERDVFANPPKRKVHPIQNVYSYLFRPFQVVSSHLLTENGFEFDKQFGSFNWEYVRQGQHVGRYPLPEKPSSGKRSSKEPETSIDELYMALSDSYILFPKPPHLRRLYRPLFWLASEVRLPRTASTPMSILRKTEDKLFTRQHFANHIARVVTKNRESFMENLHSSPALTRKGANDPYTFVSQENLVHFNTNTGELAGKVYTQQLRTSTRSGRNFRLGVVLETYSNLAPDEYVRKDLRDSIVYFPYELSSVKSQGLVVYPTPQTVQGEHFLTGGPPYSSARITIPFPLHRFDQGNKFFLGISPPGIDYSRSDEFVEAQLHRRMALARKTVPWVKLQAHKNYILSEMSCVGDAYLFCDSTLSEPEIDTVSVRGSSFSSVGATYYNLWQTVYAFGQMWREQEKDSAPYLAEIHPAFSRRGDLVQEFGASNELPEPIRPVERDPSLPPPKYPVNQGR